MKTILIANQKGGCGKTLVVDELAFSFDRTDVKYSLYDLDGQGGIIHEPKVIDDADYAIVDTPGYISDNLGELIQGGRPDYHSYKNHIQRYSNIADNVRVD